MNILYYIFYYGFWWLTKEMIKLKMVPGNGQNSILLKLMCTCRALGPERRGGESIQT